jgi:hypothetical protein
MKGLPLAAAIAALSLDGKPARKGRPRIEDRARTIEARKPWLKLNMSRRTWYRRQAEKRAAGIEFQP